MVAKSDVGLEIISFPVSNFIIRKASCFAAQPKSSTCEDNALRRFAKAKILK